MANSARIGPMELQPIVGAECAHCHDKVLVDLDGKNCKRCGLAMHKRCGAAHRSECANRPALRAETHDYDEVAPLRWTPRMVAMIAAGAFLSMLALGMLTASPAADSASESAPAMPKSRIAIVLSALVGGIVLAGGGFAWEQRRQRATRGS